MPGGKLAHEGGKPFDGGFGRRLVLQVGGADGCRVACKDFLPDEPAELLGGFTDSGGQILSPDADWVATGSLQWPLPQTFTITSQFGYRQDPFTGEVSYHNGTDIAAPAGTPILAAASGTVTIANGIDPWVGSYGYHIKIDHGGGLETLFAHCSAICVTAGQQVQQGEVIGYVGTTGNSTGNHLHFEAWVSGQRVDAMSFFAAT